MALLPGSPAINAATGNSYGAAAFTLDAPSLSIQSGQGILPANTTLTYRITAITIFGETLASQEFSVTTGSGGSNAVQISVPRSSQHWSYRIYGRTQGSEQLIGELGSDPFGNPDLPLTFVDNGSQTPNGTLPTGTLPTPDVPSISVQANRGALPAQTTLTYRVTTLSFFGETLASQEFSVTTGTNANNTVVISIPPSTAGWSFRIYGRTQGSEQLIGEVFSSPDYGGSGPFTFVDDGSQTPSGALPTANTTSTLKFDQRGIARPQGAAWDIGAFEVQSGAGAGTSIGNATVAAADEPLPQKSITRASFTPSSGVDTNSNNTDSKR
jgi:hypothetical protein